MEPLIDHNNMAEEKGNDFSSIANDLTSFEIVRTELSKIFNNIILNSIRWEKLVKKLKDVR